MGLHTFGGAPADVLTDAAGNVVARYTGGANAGQPIRLTVWTGQDRATQVTALYAMDGVTPLPGYVTPVTTPSSPNYGRVMFRASDVHAALWLWDGNPSSDPWLVWARETPGNLTQVLGLLEAMQGFLDAAEAARDAAQAAAADGTAALALAETATTAAQAASAAVAGLASQQYALETNAVTTTELVQVVRFGDEGDAAISANQVNPLWVAPFTCRLESVTLLFSNYSRTVSATDFHEFAIRKNVATTNSFIVSKRTSGEAVTAKVPWRFAGADNWNEANRVLNAGDALFLNILFNGAAGNVAVPFLAVFRYSPS